MVYDLLYISHHPLFTREMGRLISILQTFHIRCMPLAVTQVYTFWQYSEHNQWTCKNCGDNPSSHMLYLDNEVIFYKYVTASGMQRMWNVCNMLIRCPISLVNRGWWLIYSRSTPSVVDMSIADGVCLLYGEMLVCFVTVLSGNFNFQSCRNTTIDCQGFLSLLQCITRDLVVSMIQGITSQKSSIIA